MTSISYFILIQISFKFVLMGDQEPKPVQVFAHRRKSGETLLEPKQTIHYVFFYFVMK